MILLQQQLVKQVVRSFERCDVCRDLAFMTAASSSASLGLVKFWGPQASFDLLVLLIRVVVFSLRLVSLRRFISGQIAVKHR